MSASSSEPVAARAPRVAAGGVGVPVVLFALIFGFDWPGQLNIELPLLLWCVAGVLGVVLLERRRFRWYGGGLLLGCLLSFLGFAVLMLIVVATIGS